MPVDHASKLMPVGNHIAAAATSNGGMNGNGEMLGSQGEYGPMILRCCSESSCCCNVFRFSCFFISLWEMLELVDMKQEIDGIVMSSKPFVVKS